MKQYNYLIVGSGLYGAICAHKAASQGMKSLVIEKRSHLGGNLYCENIEGINVHKYGAHIFHTSNKEVWNFVNSFVEFNRYTNFPLANYKGKLYNLPLIKGLLSGIETKCNTDFFANREYFEKVADKIVFTGKIDELAKY